MGMAAWPQRFAVFCFAGVGGFGGVRCQKKSKILKFGAERNELLDFCCNCCILGLETRLLLLMNLPLRSEGN